MIEYSSCLIKLGAKYSAIKAEELLPARTIIMCKIRNEVDDAMKIAMQEINEHFVAFTIDLWTDNYTHKNSFSLICHFISKNWELIDITLRCREFTSGRKTAENIRNEILNFMHAIELAYGDINQKCFL